MRRCKDDSGSITSQQNGQNVYVEKWGQLSAISSIIDDADFVISFYLPVLMTGCTSTAKPLQ